MSYFVASNESAILQKVKKITNRSGLQVRNEVRSKGFKCISFRKRVKDVNNHVKIGDDWVCAAGTIIRDGDIGGRVLHEVYNTFRKGSIEDVQNEVYGHYAIGIKVEDTVSFFTDGNGTIPLYYYSGGTSLISTSLSLAKEALGLGVQTTNLIIRATQLSIPGKRTLVEDVYRLQPSEVLLFDLPGGYADIEGATVNFEESRDCSASINTCIERVTEEINRVCTACRGVGKIGLHCTGGLDSRTMLASLLNNGINPFLLYGTGNSSLTNTKNEDRSLVKRLSKYYNLPVYLMDWSGRHPHSVKKMTSSYQRYGFDYITYGCSDNFVREINGDIEPYPDLHIGGYSPVFTNMKIWNKNPNKKYSIEYLFDQYIDRSLRLYNRRDYDRITIKSIRQALDNSRYKFNLDEMSLSDYVKARLYLYIQPESRFLRLVNQFAPYIAPFLTRDLFDCILSVSPELRKNDRFQIELTRYIKDDSYKVPVFSGTKRSLIESHNQTMKRPLLTKAKDTVKSYASSLLKDYLKRSTTFNYLYMKKVDYKIRKSHIEYINNESCLGEYIQNPRVLTVRHLSRLVRLDVARKTT
jgi:hypothetical protein